MCDRACVRACVCVCVCVFSFVCLFLCFFIKRKLCVHFSSFLSFFLSFISTVLIYYPDTWLATHRLRRIYLHVLGPDAVMRELIMSEDSLHITMQAMTLF